MATGAFEFSVGAAFRALFARIFRRHNTNINHIQNSPTFVIEPPRIYVVDRNFPRPLVIDEHPKPAPRVFESNEIKVIPDDSSNASEIELNPNIEFVARASTLLKMEIDDDNARADFEFVDDEQGSVKNSQ